LSFSNFRFPIYSISDFRIELGFSIGFVIGDGFIAVHKNGDQFVRMFYNFMVFGEKIKTMVNGS